MLTTFKALKPNYLVILTLSILENPTTMNEIIFNLLKTNGRIILPDFGAFIIKQKTPFKVIFNEFLQYNDGALIGAVAEKFNIERDKAATKVKELVSEFTADLEKNNPIVIEGVGTLTKTPTGKIILNEPGQAGASAESKKVETTTPTVEFDLTDTKKKETTNKVKAAKVSTEKPRDKAALKQEAPKTTEKNKVAPPKSATTVKKDSSEKKKGPTPQEAPPIAEYYKEDASRKRVNIIVWIILIVLVNGAIIGYFVFDDEIKGLFGKKELNHQEQQIETPAIADDLEIAPDTTNAAQDELVIEETAEVEKPDKLFAGKKYFVVAGVFGDEANAENLAEELIQKGYNAEKFGKIGNMFAVSYDVFPTKQEANKFMLQIKKEVDTEAWIKAVN